jgi:hypothetical protein
VYSDGQADKIIERDRVWGKGVTFKRASSWRFASAAARSRSSCALFSSAIRKRSASFLSASFLCSIVVSGTGREAKDDGAVAPCSLGLAALFLGLPLRFDSTTNHCMREGEEPKRKKETTEKKKKMVRATWQSLLACEQSPPNDRLLPLPFAPPFEESGRLSVSSCDRGRENKDESKHCRPSKEYVHPTLQITSRWINPPIHRRREM